MLKSPCKDVFKCEFATEIVKGKSCDGVKVCIV
jgi:hypothetical protein